MTAVRFKTAKNSDVVMEKKSLLKEKGEKIYIDPDLTQKERGIQNFIRKQKYEIKKDGKTRVKVDIKKIFVNGKKYTFNEEAVFFRKKMKRSYFRNARKKRQTNNTTKEDSAKEERRKKRNTMKLVIWNVKEITIIKKLLRQLGTGIWIGKMRIASIMNADDNALIAKSEEDLEEMIRRLSMFLKDREMKFSVENSKIMIFGQARGRKNKNGKHWWRKNEEIAEKEMVNYLGCLFKKENNAKDHIKEKPRRPQ